MQSIKVKCDLTPTLGTITWNPSCIKYCRHTVKVKTNSLLHRPKWSSNKIWILQTKFAFEKKTNLTSLIYVKVVVWWKQQVMNAVQDEKGFCRLEWMSSPARSQGKHSKVASVSEIVKHVVDHDIFTSHARFIKMYT